MKVLSLFSGCGGLDMGFVKNGYKIVWANDIDKYAVQTYKANFHHDVFCGDINCFDPSQLPKHDMIIGGFPCQPFSIMGSEKGFDDTRGTLFFTIANIIKYDIEHNQKPIVVILENVRSLKTHDKGRTFAVIKKVLEKDLGYTVFDTILNSSDYGVPQTTSILRLMN